MTNQERYVGIIKKLIDAPDSQLDKAGTKLCAEFDPDKDDPVRFIRNLLDLCVRYAWSSGLVLTLLNATIEGEPPESEEEAETRHQELLARWEPET